MPRDGWTVYRDGDLRWHELRREGKVVADVVRWSGTRTWRVWIGLKSLGETVTVREGKALAEATLAAESR